VSNASEKLKAMAEERGLTKQPVERKVVQLGKTYKVTEQRPERRLGQAVVGQRMLRVVCSSVEDEMLQVLIDLEVASNGTTTSFDSSGGGVFGSKVPISGGCDMRTDPPHIFWRKQWDAAGNDARRREVLGLARDELRRLQKASPPPRGLQEETEGERNERLLRDGDGWRAEEVAVTFKMTPSAVRKIRRQHGRDPERGTDDLDAPMPYGTVEERRRRARTLIYERGLSLRAAALKMGVSHETVRKDLMASRGSKAA